MTTGKRKAPRGVSIRRAFEDARADMLFRPRSVLAGEERQRQMERSALGDRLVYLLLQAADVRSKLLTWIQGEEKAQGSPVLSSLSVAGTVQHAMDLGRQALEMAIDVLNVQIDDTRYELARVQRPHARPIAEYPSGFPAQAATAAIAAAAVSHEERAAQGTTPPTPNPADCVRCGNAAPAQDRPNCTLFRPLADGRCNNYITTEKTP